MTEVDTVSDHALTVRVEQYAGVVYGAFNTVYVVTTSSESRAQIQPNHPDTDIFPHGIDFAGITADG